MNAEREAEIRSKISAKSRRVAELAARQAEGGLSRRERAELGQIADEVRLLRRQVQHRDFNPRLAQGTSRRTTDESPAILERGQSVSEWVEERGLARDLPLEDRKHLSLARLARGMATGRWDGAELEHRALAEGTDSTGGALLAPELAAFVIDRLAPATRVLQLGARIVPMHSQEMYLGRMTGPAGASWKSEGQTIDDSGPTFDSLHLVAHTLPVLIKASWELVQDWSEAAMQELETEIYRALAIGVDSAALFGSGSDPEPRGLLNTSNVDLTQLGSSDGGPIEWDDLLTAAGTIRDNNLEPSGFLASSRTWTSLNGRKDSLGRYLLPPTSIADLPQLSSNIIVNTDTVGSSTACSKLYAGDWRQLLLAYRVDAARFGIRQLTERYASEGQIGFLAYLRCDVAVAHPEGFSIITGITPDE
jgi:HK97 family phage major capsid protein